MSEGILLVFKDKKSYANDMKVIQRHKECIGCGACTAVCPDFWEMGDDNKAKPKEGGLNPNTGDYEAEIKEVSCNQDAAEACPVQVIKIV